MPMNVTINAMQNRRRYHNGRGVLARHAIVGINEQCPYREQVISCTDTADQDRRGYTWA
jgi:hypothetical protein